MVKDRVEGWNDPSFHEINGVAIASKHGKTGRILVALPSEVDTDENRLGQGIIPSEVHV